VEDYAYFNKFIIIVTATGIMHINEWKAAGIIGSVREREVDDFTPFGVITHT
jgi:hypothetical protein